MDYKKNIHDDKNIDNSDNEDILFTKYKKEKKHRYMAAILAICCGIFGMHKFYLDNEKMGFIYMFASIIGIILTGVFVQILQTQWFLLFAIIPHTVVIISIIEGIKFFRMSDEEFQKTYCS